MLGWIYIWRGELGVHEVKVRFGNLWYYLLINYSLDDRSILETGKILKNTSSARERWTRLGEPDYKDYRDLSLYELARIIFLGAPEDERKEREAEWEGLGSYYRRRLPKEIILNLYWYPNRFDLLFPSLDLTIEFWKRLPRRDHKRKPKNIVKWFDSAVDTGDHSDYLCQPFGNFEVNLDALIWWLGEERSGVLLEKMFGEI